MATYDGSSSLKGCKGGVNSRNMKTRVEIGLEVRSATRNVRVARFPSPVSSEIRCNDRKWSRSRVPKD